MFSPLLVCPSVHLSVYQQDYSKSYDPIFMNLSGPIEHDQGKNPHKLGTGQPEGGAVIITLTFWPMTFEPQDENLFSPEFLGSIHITHIDHALLRLTRFSNILNLKFFCISSHNSLPCSKIWLSKLSGCGSFFKSAILHECIS